MHYLLVKHKIADFAQWKRVFENNATAAQKAGIEFEHIFRDTTDTGLVFVLCRIDDLSKAKAFTQSQGASDSARRGGVIGTPEGWWLSEEKAAVAHVD